MSYNHLTIEERHYIEVQSKNGTSANIISMHLGRSQTTISRELKRNKGLRGYRYKQADKIAQKRHTNKPKNTKLTDTIKAMIRSYLEDDWSPEQIAGRLKFDGIISLHHETIYKYILADKQSGGTLYTYLRHQGKKYRKRYGCSNNRTGIPDRIDISERPEVANNRERLGDWEADTIIEHGHQGAIVTLDERVTKLRLAAPLEGKKAEPVSNAIVELLNPLKDYVETMTFDNGKEFAKHSFIASNLACRTYFAAPYHSWERGQNENANGLLRQYFPKGISLKNIEFIAVLKAVHKLNTRPRKCLGYRTPIEVFLEETGIKRSILVGYALIG